MRYVSRSESSQVPYVAEPPSLTALRAIDVPPVGGDTCWGSMYAAYDALSAPMRDMLDGLTAEHSVYPVIQRMGPMGQDYANHAAPTHGRLRIFIAGATDTGCLEAYWT